MTRASIWQTDDAVGFHWLSASGVAATLSDVVAEPDSEPHRLLPTHLEAVDDVLIDAVGRWGDILGGGREPTADEVDHLAELHQGLNRLCLEYADALKAVGATADVRAGQIIGTAALVSRLARVATGTAGPEPLSDELDEPPVGVVSGFADLVHVDPDRPGLGARWVVRTETGLRLPANLHMLLHDSSGVFKDAALDEHRGAMRDALGVEGSTGPDTSKWTDSLEWLLDDFLLAHRESPSSAAVTLRPGRRDDAQLIVSAAAAVTRSRLPPNS